MTASSNSSADVVRIKDLGLTVSLDSGSRWPSTTRKLQPVSVSLSITHDVSLAARNDDISESINYSTVYGSITELSNAHYESLEILSDKIFDIAFASCIQIRELAVEVAQLKGPLHTHSIRVISSRTRGGAKRVPDRLFCDDLLCHAIIGVKPHEREEKQVVVLNIAIDQSRVAGKSYDFRGLARTIYNHVSTSYYLTLEALASSVALETLRHTNDTSAVVTIRASKPDALVLAESAEVEISRSSRDFPGSLRLDPTEERPSVTPLGLPPSERNPTVAETQHSATNLARIPTIHPPMMSLLSRRSSTTESTSFHSAAVALGTNMGDRFANIELSLRLLEAPHLFDISNGKVAITDTSFMYETVPMYVTDQPMFINCACLVETNLPPLALLSFLKKIEVTVGRTPTVRYGPRVVDLDLLVYDTESIDTRAEDCRANLENLEGELVVPHPRMAEREFVLRPMNDMIPNYVHPVLNKTVEVLLKEIASSGDNPIPMRKVTPFPRYPVVAKTPPSSSVLLRIAPVPSTLSYWTFPISGHASRPRKVYVMATLNATPDSFSDGSVNNSLSAAISYTTSSVTAGADIVDIGGHSTRPGAAYVSNEEEISRVVPVIHALRDQGFAELNDTPISVDTFRRDVAKAAVLAGANCINDVHAFTGREFPLTQASAEHLLSMRELARELAVPIVLMHSRGEAGSNQGYSSYPGGVLEGVRVELGDKVDAIVKGRGGVRRWFILVDPGIGFSKGLSDNLEILRHASLITAETTQSSPSGNPLAGYPQLIGASKKSFLGSILAEPELEGRCQGRQTEPKDRGWATAASVACAVQQGAAVVRVHDVPEMMDVVRVSSAIWGR